MDRWQKESQSTKCHNPSRFSFFPPCIWFKKEHPAALKRCMCLFWHDNNQHVLPQLGWLC